MNGFEVKRLTMQFRRRNLSITLKFPGKDVGEFIVVAQGFAFRRLMFLAEMRAA